MKYIWELQDIKAGQRYKRPHAAEVWSIGYLAWVDKPKDRVSVSLSDGCVTCPKTAEEMVIMLNEEGYIPVEKESKEG